MAQKNNSLFFSDNIVHSMDKRQTDYENLIRFYQGNINLQEEPLFLDELKFDIIEPSFQDNDIYLEEDNINTDDEDDDNSDFNSNLY